jgi:Reverse transcriptase (RNA-dependent DNA polymerase)
LSLAKKSKKDGSLGDIKRDNGTEFSDANERSSFIVNYYRSIFKLKPEHQNNVEGGIDTFLGPDVLENPVVKNSKLTAAEADRIAKDFNLPELDEVVKDLNTKSAGGPNGLSNGVIKKIWKYIRVPLKNYANFCNNKGPLSHSFRTAAIRLIPKKGDASKIGNWRPISLLNCIFKVISNAINNRLKKVATRVLSRAQKGFVPGRYIQECIMNLVETINFCEKKQY